MNPSIDAIEADLLQRLEKVRAVRTMEEEAAKMKERAEMMKAALLAEVGGVSRQPETILEAKRTTQIDVVLGILKQDGPMDRNALYEKMRPSGKAPAAQEQLSAVLSRLKRDGVLTVSVDGLWGISGRESVEQPTRATKGRNFALVFDFLKKNGPTGVTAIGIALGLPKTSVSTVLHSRSDYFVGDNGVWRVRDAAPTPSA